MIIFELNTRLYDRTLDQIAGEEIDRLAGLGFDWIWLMGLWRIGPRAIEISRGYAVDFQGSPYAIASYEVEPALGGEAALRRFVERAHRAGMRVMADFVPNHMAIDSPLIDVHPDFAIHSNPALRTEQSGDFFDHPRGRLAYGKDPYFPPWTDTVQLDYAHRGLRAYQIDVLKRIATMVDGVRCDMAMLVLNEHVRNYWFPHVDRTTFDRHFPEEFWSEAISRVKAERAEFIFMAEVYWDKEPIMQELGFDLTYDKKLYDLLVNGEAPEHIAERLRSLPQRYLERSVHFLENHDEERASVCFGDRARPSAILSYAIPGALFVHQGQMEGFTEKLPVQRVRPRLRETKDEALYAFYAKLLRHTGDPLYRRGAMKTLGALNGTVLWLRHHEGRTVLAGADPRGLRRPRSPALRLSGGELGLSPDARIRCIDSWSGAVVENDGQVGHLTLAEGAIPSWEQNQAFLLEISRG